MHLQNHHVRRSPLIFLWKAGERKKFVPKWSGVVKKERGGGGEIFSFFPTSPPPPHTIHYNPISNTADPKKNHELVTLTWLHYRLESILPKNLTEGKWKWKEQFKESIYQQVISFFFFFSFFSHVLSWYSCYFIPLKGQFLSYDVFQDVIPLCERVHSMVNKVFSNNAEVVMGKLVQNIHEDVLKVLIILVCGVFFSHLSF